MSLTAENRMESRQGGKAEGRSLFSDEGGIPNPKALLEGMTKKEELAHLLVIVGAEVAATILKDFDEKEVEDLSKEMVKIDFIPGPLKDAILAEFSAITIEAVASTSGGATFAKLALEKALGSFKASEIIRRVAPYKMRSVDVTVLRDIQPRPLMNLLRKEQLQTWALVLSYLEPPQCAEVIELLPPDFRVDLVERLATMEPVASEVVEIVLQHIQRSADLRNRQDVTTSGGAKILADVLNQLEDASSKQVLTSLEERNPELSRTIKKMLFTFEDIITLDKASLGKLLREVDFHELAVALKTASEVLRTSIFATLTKRASEIIQEEIQYMPPVRLVEVEQAQERIIEQMRRLEASGEIVRAKGGDGDAVV